MTKRLHILIALVLSLGLSACGMPGGNTSGEQDQQQARDEFLTERGGTAVAGGPSENTPLAGTVERVDGQTIVMKNMEDNNKELMIQLTSDTKIQQDMQIKPADIKVGDPITAFGMKNGEVIQADIVQIGNDDMMGGEGVTIESGTSAGAEGSVEASEGVGAAPAPGGSADMPGGTQPQQVTGTVESVEDTKIVVKQSDGSLATIESTSATEIHKQGEAKVTDIQAGSMIMVSGVRDGDNFQATQVRLLPAPSLARP
ncbi:MAG TPA: DUF5666 domain-containing protein [Herpetosiphonaceae bacterium]